MRKRFTHNSADGTTLVELAVVLSVVLALMGTAYSLSLASRRLYDADRARTRVQQSLRAGVEFLGADVRQAGERLPDDFPAIEIAAAGGDSDRLVLRRSTDDTVLRLCRDVVVGVEELSVIVPAGSGPVPPGCSFPDEDGDGWNDNLQAWRARRLAAGGSIPAYVYDPVSRGGEFFRYVAESPDRLAVVADEGTGWTRPYRVADQARLYLLEERAYDVRDGVLTLTVNQTDEPYHLVDRIEAFRVRALLQDGTLHETLEPDDLWLDLRSLEIVLSGSADVRDRTIRRSWTTRVMPRNVISR